MIRGKARNLASGLTPWRRALQGASDQSIPSSARAKKAIGSAQAGRASDRDSARGSTVKASAISHSVSAMLTPLVDHGKRIATRTANRSTFKIRAAGSCRADHMTESQEMPGSLPTSVILIPYAHRERVFRAKACPALDAGWVPVRVKKTRQNKRTTALEPGALVTFAAGSCKSLSHELAQGTRPRGPRLPSRQFERGVAAGGARADRRKGCGRFHLCRCRAHGGRQPGGAVPAFSRPRRIAFQHRPARLRAIRSALDQGLG